MPVFAGGPRSRLQMFPQATINSVAKLPSFRLDPADASVAAWPVDVYGAAPLASNGSGDDPTVGLDGPRSGEKAVLFNDGKGWEGSPQTVLGLDDWVTEIVINRTAAQVATGSPCFIGGKIQWGGAQWFGVAYGSQHYPADPAVEAFIASMYDNTNPGIQMFLTFGYGWHLVHIVVDRSGNMCGYVDGALQSTVDISAHVAINHTVTKQTLGAGVALWHGKTGGIEIGSYTEWQGLNWLDSGQQDAFAAGRYAKWIRS